MPVEAAAIEYVKRRKALKEVLADTTCDHTVVVMRAELAEDAFEKLDEQIRRAGFSSPEFVWSGAV